MTGSSAHWDVTSGHLAVRYPDGTTKIPTAEQIYRAAIEKADVSGLPPMDPAHVLTDLKFSKYPLQPLVDIEDAGTQGKLWLGVRVLARGYGVETSLPDISEGAPDHVICEGQWYPLVPEGLEAVRKVLSDAGISSPGPINLRQYLALQKIDRTDSAIIEDNSAGAAGAACQRATPDFAPSPLFAGTLYPYQNDGLRWLQTISREDLGGILADEMGLGKTVQIAALFSAESAEGRKPSLVVAPGTLLENWRRELGRFAPSLEVSVHRGRDRTGFPSELRNLDVAVTSYDTLTRDLPMFRAIDWNVVVLDEAQAIKNPETRRAIAAKRLPRRVGLAVTGTPVENRLSDLWSLTDFALPDFLGPQAAFEAGFQNDEDSASRLERLISPILLRRRVADVAADLPPLITVPQVMELDAEQAAAYEAVRQSTIEQYGERADLVVLTRLRMFCTHPRLVGETGARSDPSDQSSKYLRLTEILQEIVDNGEKAILFTSFNDMADMLVQDLPSRFGIPVAVIDGRTPVDQRQAVVDSFSGVHGGALLVLNPRAAGTGLNVTAANHVIHYNLEWNPAVEDQASARAYRRGQTRPVTVHRLYYADTVEEVINDRLDRKRQLASAAVVGTDGRKDDVGDILAALRRSPIRETGNGAN